MLTFVTISLQSTTLNKTIVILLKYLFSQIWPCIWKKKSEKCSMFWKALKQYYFEKKNEPLSQLL